MNEIEERFSNTTSLSIDSYHPSTKESKDKWKQQRIERGFADCDVWNMDDYLMRLVPDMLDVLADTSQGYPERIGESWKEHLQKLASDIRAYHYARYNGEEDSEKLEELFSRMCSIFHDLWD